MQIIINEDEIMDALKAYVGEQVVTQPGSEVKIVFTAGRGENGTRATIDIIKSEEAAAVHEAFSTKEEQEVKKDLDAVEDIMDTAAKEEPPKPEPKPKAKPAPEKAPAPEVKIEPEVKPEPKQEVVEEEAKETVTAGAAVGKSDSLFNF